MEETKKSNVDYIDIMQIFSVLLRNWFVIVCVSILGAVFGFVYSNFFITPLYRANATMLVDLRNSVQDDLSAEKINNAEKYVTTFTYVMKTNTVLQPVINKLELNESVDSLGNKLQINKMDGTLLIRVAINHENPQDALEIVKAVCETAPDVINQRITSCYIIEIEAPSVTGSPVTPNVTRYTIFGAGAGAAFAVMVLLLISFLNNKIRSVLDLQNTVDLPLLGVIPTLVNTETNGKGV